MIPKVIHYCWFGRKEKPQQVVRFIEVEAKATELYHKRME